MVAFEAAGARRRKPAATAPDQATKAHHPVVE
jgi:hypothetical protein